MLIKLYNLYMLNGWNKECINGDIFGDTFVYIIYELADWIRYKRRVIGMYCKYKSWLIINY